MGELHLEVAVEKIRRAQGVDIAVGRPRVAYRETVVRGVSGHVYRHVKQEGGAGQFAHVVLDVGALEEAADGAGGAAGASGAEGFAFRSTVTGGRVPQEYVRAVEAGCRDALLEGPLGGHPVTGVRVTLTDGATHSKDSSEMAFRTAARFALREALRASAMTLLEPVVEVTVTVPDSAVGGVLGDGPAGRALRLRVPPARTHPGPGHVHHPARRLRPGPGRPDGRPVARLGPASSGAGPFVGLTLVLGVLVRALLTPVWS
jgi:elongation factor G